MDCNENVNLFQPTSFRVIIDRKFYKRLQFYVQSVNHPGAQNAAADTPYSRIGGVPLPGNTMTYGELTMNVLLDEDFESYIEMYDWMLRLVNEEQVASPMRNSSQDPIPTYADIHVHALTNANNHNRLLKYIDCVPVSVGDINFEATNQGVEAITFQASFRFSYFEIE
jgi:hypothetical protein